MRKERLKLKRVWVFSILLAVILAACTQSQGPKPTTGKVITIGVMPKLKGIAFFNAAEKGAREAGSALGIHVDYDGPVTNDVTLQAQMVETWIAKKYDAIAIAPNDPEAIGPVLAKARKRGIKVIAWDSDARKDVSRFLRQPMYTRVSGQGADGCHGQRCRKTGKISHHYRVIDGS